MWEKYKEKIIFYLLYGASIIGLFVPLICVLADSQILSNASLVVLFCLMIVGGLFSLIIVILSLVNYYANKKNK